MRMAFLLLMVQSFWMVAPVCGSVTDVDARACCERHSPCHKTDGNDPQPADPWKCCAKGDHAYPSTFLRFLTAPELGVASAVVLAEPAQPIAPASCVLDPVFPLKLPIIPLYLLDSNYRI
jgi:hypothetical protein